MKPVKMRSFTFYWNESETTKSEKVVAINFATALKAKFGNNIPNITSVYSDEVTAYIE